MIIIDHHIEDEVLTDYFFIEGTIDINSEYFIEKIKKDFKKIVTGGLKLILEI